MNPPLVYVLVINWNGLEHLQECFSSLCTSTYENARFVLIDNASTDSSVAYVREQFGHDPRVEVLQLPANLGWSGGNNAGIEHAISANAEYVFLLNNDTSTRPDALQLLVAMMEATPAAAMLAPKMLMFDDPQIINSVGLECSRIGASWDRAIGRADTGAWDTPEKVIGVCGGAMFIRSKVFSEVGILPAEFGIYLDDLDLCLRALNAGYEIWTCPQAVVRHKFSATWGAGARAQEKYFLNTRNRFWLILRNFPVTSISAVLPAVVLGECRALGRALLNKEPWRVKAHLRAWLAALRYLPRAIATRRKVAQNKSSFWPLVLRRPYFFPGTEFPRQGWYTERTVQMHRLRPMSLRAEVQVQPGRLRVFHANCYPALGPTSVRATHAGASLAHFSTLDVEEVLLDIPQAGTLELAAERLYRMEDTGERMDIGGWFFIENVETLRN